MTECNHDDIDAEKVELCLPAKYRENLAKVVVADSKQEYEEIRKATGICKMSLMYGLSRTLELPRLFSEDMMHLSSLNIPDLFLALWRGTIDCRLEDDKSTWDWAVLKGVVWQNHGRDVANISSYLSGYFGGALRNISEKVSSGYKAWEFKIWFYIYGPGLLRGILPNKYWRHYCKLVMGLRLAHQRSITVEQTKYIHQLLVSFHKEFEEIYYQRDPDRIHFIRQSVHALLYVGPKARRIGPHAYYAQWTMECVIGDLGQEIKQSSNPFANLSQRAVLRAQINSLQGTYPVLRIQPLEYVPPHHSKDVGGGFFLLRKRDRHRKVITDAPGQAIKRFWNCLNTTGSEYIPKIHRWAHLHLPNGQIARSLWKEERSR